MGLKRIGAWLSVPWTGFVVAFLYYAAVTASLLGGASPDGQVVAGVYLAPLMAYLGAIGVRVSGALRLSVLAPQPVLRTAFAGRAA